MPLGVNGLEAHLDRAWPALTSFGRGPFVLRFADGYGRRSNCAVPVPGAAQGDPSAISAVEREFEARALRPTFKLVEDGPSVTALAEALTRRGYAPTDAFTVFVRRSSAAVPRPIAPPSAIAPSVVPLDPARGAAALVAVGATDARHRAELAAILGRMPPLASCATSVRAGAVVAAAVSVVEGELASIHQLATHPAFRGRGLARALILALVEHAEAHGARATIAQVARANRAGTQLFAASGFLASHDYAYFERVAG